MKIIQVIKTLKDVIFLPVYEKSTSRFLNFQVLMCLYLFRVLSERVKGRNKG